MFANSRFKKSVDEWGRVKEWIEPGDKVTQSDLGVSDEEWKGLIEGGALVDKYPEALKNDPQTPPAEYYRKNPDDDEDTTDTPDKEEAPAARTPVAASTTATTAPTTTEK